MVLTPRHAICAKLVFSIFYTALALSCIRQWGGSIPWLRLDRLSACFLGTACIAAAYDLMFGLGRRAFRSSEAVVEAAGMAFDGKAMPVKSLLLAFDALAFLDYGHWRLVPALEAPAMRGSGLVVEGVATVWLMWVGARLATHFAGEAPTRTVIQDGPFRYVRHPRYAGTLATRVAFALTFSSVIAWVLLPVWVLFTLGRIRREERHLEEIFGGEYAAYARRTPRLVPSLGSIAHAVEQRLYLRKAYHIVGGGLAALGLLRVDAAWFVAAGVMYLVVFRVLSKRIAFGVAGILALLVLTDSKLTALSGTVIWGVGDALAAVVGSRCRSIPWPWRGRKSLAGTLAFAVGATLAMSVMLYVHGVTHLVGFAVLALVPSVVGCVVEALPLTAIADQSINDNFPVILSSGLAFHGLSGVMRLGSGL